MFVHTLAWRKNGATHSHVVGRIGRERSVGHADGCWQRRANGPGVCQDSKRVWPVGFSGAFHCVRQQGLVESGRFRGDSARGIHASYGFIGVHLSSHGAPRGAHDDQWRIHDCIELLRCGKSRAWLQRHGRGQGRA